MRTNKPEANGWQLDRCEVCGDKMHRRNLVRTQVEFLRPKSENYFSYSSYDGTYWVVDDAVDAGLISFGTQLDETRLALADDNTFSVVGGIQTWTGNGTIRTETLSPNLDTSGDVVFSLEFGPNYRNTSPSSTVVLGVCNSDGSVKQAVKTYTDVSGSSRLWFSEDAGTLIGYGLGSGNQFYFYAQVTNAGNWWIDRLQLEKNPPNSVPGPFEKTSGTLVSNQSDTQMVTSRKVCADCFENVLKKSEQYGKTSEPPSDGPVDTHAQEF